MDGKNKKMPVLFVGHGSPMNIIFNNTYTQALARAGKELPHPVAILVISAHWLTKGLFVTCDHKPRQIYDFYGFPDMLYMEKYDCHGSPEFAKKTSGLVKSSKVECSLDWGLDHGSWSVLKHMYPKAKILVNQLSIDYTKQPQYHYDLGKELAGLRREGVLIIGSGNIVHNLRLVDFENIDADIPGWATEFDEKVKSCLLENNHDELINYKNLGNPVKLSVPTNDHYLPMLTVLGMMEKDEKVEFIHEGFQYGTVSMRCFRFG